VLTTDQQEQTISCSEWRKRTTCSSGHVSVSGKDTSCSTRTDRRTEVMQTGMRQKYIWPRNNLSIMQRTTPAKARQPVGETNDIEQRCWGKKMNYSSRHKHTLACYSNRSW